jgi:hypothetical protein
MSATRATAFSKMERDVRKMDRGPQFGAGPWTLPNVNPRPLKAYIVPTPQCDVRYTYTPAAVPGPSTGASQGAGS